MNNLKKCPICSSDGRIEQLGDEETRIVFSPQCSNVDCILSQTYGTFARRIDAANAWNHRAPDRELIRYALVQSGYEFNPQRLFESIDAAVETIASGWEKQS